MKKSLNGFLFWLTDERDLLINSSLVLLSNIASNAFLFITNIMLSNILGPTDFGLLKTTLYLFFLIGSFADLGMSITFVRYIPRLEKKKIPYLARQLVKIRVGTYLLLAAALLIMRSELSLYFLHDRKYAGFMVFGITIFAANFFMFLRHMVIGYENFRLFSITSIVERSLYMVLAITAAYYLNLSFILLFLAVSSTTASLICVNFLVKKGLFSKRYKVLDWKRIFFGYSIPMNLLSIPDYLGAGITPLLGLFFAPEAMGYFSFAFMFYFVGLILPSSFVSVMFPKVSRLHSDRKTDKARDSLIRVLAIHTIFTVMGIAAIALFSDKVLLLIAVQYMPGIAIFKTLSALSLILGYMTILSSYFKARGHVRNAAVIVFIQNLALFAVSFIILSLSF